jgi:hypothetical protein
MANNFRAYKPTEPDIKTDTEKVFCQPAKVGCYRGTVRQSKITRKGDQNFDSENSQ